MTEKKVDSRRWFEKITECKNLNLERTVEYKDMAWWNPPVMEIPIDEDDKTKGNR
ncbi:hypothetical protein [Candidatus Magnetobacterium casense]|uniref:Uncharacterized protein n=1 Tax=Candidatus Magnetobacterium casense TaxID=1455061 RepID=A0ABS6RVH4_9BACT|nr:hypothetical protein [Candidatus Magnetobacterium casensis]MBV6340447.1 hypothetical protein [Candidatus Magnetobacterium casensis]